jgi:hypothetical protein
MDEILTRWASDLSKHQKEFQKQATQVQKWDTLLVQNTDKISKLYSKTFQAERDAVEVEKQISAVEGEQEELELWLNKYEGEVEALLQKVGANDRNGSEGVDAERERTYKMAERLTDRIEGLNNDLKDVIEEVNGVSVTLGGANGSGGDDQVRFCIYSISDRYSLLTHNSSHKSSESLTPICNNSRSSTMVPQSWEPKSRLRRGNPRDLVVLTATVA